MPIAGDREAGSGLTSFGPIRADPLDHPAAAAPGRTGPSAVGLTAQKRSIILVPEGKTGFHDMTGPCRRGFTQQGDPTMIQTRRPTGRRTFIKEGLAGLAGTAALPGVLKSEIRGSAPRAGGKRPLIFRTLGRTGIKMPILGIGASSHEKSLYERALAEGLTHIDTSQYYFNGRHEAMVGEVLKGRNRDSFVVATSILLGTGAPGSMSTLKKEDAPKLPEALEPSLKRLGLEAVDIFYVAGVNDRETALGDDFLASLQKIKEAGMARFVGVATHQGEPAVIRAAVESKVHDVVLVSYNFRQPHKAEVQAAIADAVKAGVGIVVMKPMAGAYWDGRARKQPINGKAALKWVLRDPGVTAAVPGITSVEELETDLSVMAGPLELTDAERADLKLTGGGSEPGLYCAQCGSCSEQCPAGLDVPALMRSYMYAYGYRDLGKARGALAQAEFDALPCGECGSCRVNCPMGFDVKGRVEDIARLKALPEDMIGF